MIDSFTENLFLELEQFTDLLPRLIFGILIIFLFYLLGKLISRNIKSFDPDYVELQVSFRINVKDQESTLPVIRTSVMDACRNSLINAGFTFSSDVSTNIGLGSVDVKLDRSETNNS